MANTFAMAELLKDDYRKTFEQIVLYANMSFANEQFINDRMHNLFDSFMEAQANGKPVEKIVGSNLEKFCKDYFRADSKDIWVKEILKRLFYVALLTVVFVFLECIVRREGDPIQGVIINMMPVFIGVFVGGFLMTFGRLVQRRLMFRRPKIHPAVYYIVLVVLFVGGIGLFLVLTKGISLDMSASLALSIFGGYCVVYLAGMGLYRYKKYGSFQNPDVPGKVEKAEQKALEEEITFRSDVVSCAKAMATRFQKLKAKNAKKGKSEYTMEEFTQLIKKESTWGMKVKILWIAFPIFCIITGTLRMDMTQGLTAAIVSLVVFTVVLTVIYRIFWEASKEVFTAQRAVIEECERRNISIEEYVAELE